MYEAIITVVVMEVILDQDVKKEVSEQYISHFGKNAGIISKIEAILFQLLLRSELIY